MSNGFVLGCDGGNTKTIALVAAPSGEILGWGRAGSSDVHDNPAAIDELRAAVRAACAMAACAPSQVQHAVFGLAGADWPEDYALLSEAMRTLLGGEPTILNDAVNAIRCGTPDGVGVVVSCGTGGTARSTIAASGPSPLGPARSAAAACVRCSGHTSASICQPRSRDSRWCATALPIPTTSCTS